MPELPEVETVARDLRPRILSARRSSARAARGRGRCGRTRPRPSPRRVAGPRGSRRSAGAAKQVVIELSGDAALTIHLKMTGQLFVVPADTPEDPYVRLVLELADGRELRFRDIRKFGKIGLYGRDPVTGELVAEVGGAAVFAAIGPEPLDDAFTAARVPAPAPPAQGPAQAAAARPVVPRRRRQHLRRRGAVGGPAPPAAHGRHAAPARRAAAVRGDPADPGRGGRAARQLDRRLHGARRRRLDAGAPAGLPADRRAVPALRPAGQADRDRRALDPLLLVVPAPSGRPTARAAAAILRTMTGGPRRARPALDGAGRGGERRADPGRGREGRRAGPDRADEAGRGDATGRGPRLGGRPMSILRLAGVSREVGTFVILDAIDASIALGDRIGLVGPNGAGKTTLLRLAAGRDEPDRGEVAPQARPVARAARPGGAFRRGVHGLARPADGGPDRCRAPRRDGRAAGRARARRPRRRAGLRRPAPRVRGPRRLHARPAGRDAR